jgi:hypothetical protein
MTPAEFAAKWRDATAKESAASHEHFIDLCRVLGVPTPIEADPTGEWYAFEKGASKAAGGEGFADVWKRRHFAWEYKGKTKDLGAAYLQLLNYSSALDNPPILVVCDLDRFEVRTNFTNTPTKLYTFDLADLAADPSEPVRILRALMTDPEELRPREAADELTGKAASHFAELAIGLRARGEDPQRVAHFLDKLLFCLYAEDAGVLPKGLLSRLAEATRADPAAFAAQLASLFGTMADAGGFFGVDRIDWFDGGLFADTDVLTLSREEIAALLAVGRLDWSLIEPAIFGTLFERGLDPGKRAQLGAHYTDRTSIERLVEPVVMEPLRRELVASQVSVEELLAAGGPKAREKALAVHHAFLARLRGVRVLDPACGSGNFLFVALRKLKDLEYDAIGWGSQRFSIPMEFPQVGPEAVLGIEINPYAAELARVSIWIGEIQWMLGHSFAYRRDPVLRPLDQIRTGDALLDFTDSTHPVEATWPAAEFIVGNPPFLGAKLLRRGLGNDYVEALYGVYGDRLPGMSDLCAYWHEKARAQIAAGRTRRAGLLATQGIRGGLGRRVLERITESGGIFFAWADEPWVLDGANVHISFIGQDDGSESSRTLDGLAVTKINANLTAGVDLSTARRLRESARIAFIGDVKGGPFDVVAGVATPLLAAPNPDGRSNVEVVRPWVNAEDVTGRRRGMSIIDFGVGMSLQEAALYEAPFEYVLQHVKPAREAGMPTISEWWLHMRPVPGMRLATAGLARYIATPMTSKHRVFLWLGAETLADHACVVFARDDDYAFGLLHSRVHELWARGTGTQLREVESGFRYTPTTCFETFPFPRPTDAQRDAIGAAAARLNELREGWLNPPGLSEAELAKRTLTNLYNARPTWLTNVHATLDAAVLDAYGWPADLPDAEILERLLALNLERAAAERAPAGPPTAARPALPMAAEDAAPYD